MAETTRPTSGTSTQTTSTSASPGRTRNMANPATGTAAPSSATASAGGSDQAERSPSQQPQSGQRSAGSGQRQGERGQSRAGETHIELSGHPISDAKKVGSELIGAARDSAASLIEAQRAQAADQIAVVADALRRATESFETSGSSGLAQYANQAADQVSGFADAVRDRSWSDLANDLESFARRSPALFMVAAVGLGFLAGRFLLSSSERARAVGASGAGMPGDRGREMGRDVGDPGRPARSGAPAEYGSSGIQE